RVDRSVDCLGGDCSIASVGGSEPASARSSPQRQAFGAAQDRGAFRGRVHLTRVLPRLADRTAKFLDSTPPFLNGWSWPCGGGSEHGALRSAADVGWSGRSCA